MDYKIINQRRFQYYYRKSLRIFLPKLKNGLYYTVFNTKPIFNINTKSLINKLFNQHLTNYEEKTVPIIKFYNLNEAKVKKIGRIFHVDFISPSISKDFLTK